MTTRNKAKDTAQSPANIRPEGVQAKAGTPVIGIAAVADFLGFSQRTVCNWRQEFPDFPVTQDKVSCVWESSQEALKAWRAAHPDLFTLHKERRNNANGGDDGRRPSRW